MKLDRDILSSSPLTLTLLLETLDSGKISASIFEFPNYRVEADTKEKAIDELKTAFLERFQNIEAIPWNVPLPVSEPAWKQFAGIFKDDPDFQEIMDAIRAERDSDDNSEVDRSVFS